MKSGLRNTMLVIGGILLLCASVFAQQESHLLRYSFSKGEKFLMKSTSSMDMNQSFQGQEMKMAMEMKQGVKAEVNEVTPEGVADVTLAFDSVYIKMSSPQMSFEYDSANKDPEMLQQPVVKLFDAMLGNPLTMKIDSKGKVHSITGMDAIIQKAVDSMEDLEPEMKQSMSEMMDKNFGGNIDQMMSTTFLTFPEQKVKIGDTWSDTQQINISISEVDFDVDHKLVDLKDNIAVIESSVTITPGQKETTEVMGMQMEASFSGTVNSTQKIDLKTGLVVDGLQKQDMKGQISGSMGPGQTITIPISFSGTTKVQMEKI